MSVTGEMLDKASERAFKAEARCKELEAENARLREALFYCASCRCDREKHGGTGGCATCPSCHARRALAPVEPRTEAV